MLVSNGPIRDRADWVYEVKLDSYPTMAFKDCGDVRLMSRNGKNAAPWFQGLQTALKARRGTFIIDCEVCRLDERGVPGLRGNALSYYLEDQDRHTSRVRSALRGHSGPACAAGRTASAEAHVLVGRG
jgi:hypothetical protein